VVEGGTENEKRLDEGEEREREKEGKRVGLEKAEGGEERQGGRDRKGREREERGQEEGGQEEEEIDQTTERGGTTGAEMSKVRGHLRVGVLNVGLRGMKSEIDEDRMKTVVDERDIDIMGVVEHWRGDSKRMKEALGLEPDIERRDLFGEKYQWWERCRTKGKRGGVGLIVRKDVGRVEVQEELCCESVIWAEITQGNEKILVCVAYIAPEQSVYEYERVETISKIAQGLEWAAGRNVVILMDANGRIGKLSLEVLAGGTTWVEERKSEDKQVNRQGVEVLNLLQLYGVMVRNGLLGENSGKATCRGRSVVDWIAVSWELRLLCQPLIVETAWEDGKRSEGDHKLVRLDLEWGGERRETVVATTRVRELKQERKGWNTKKGWDDEWVRVRKESDKVMRRWCNVGGERGGLEQVKTWQKSYNEVAEKSLGRKGTGTKSQGYVDKEIKDLVRKSREATLESLQGKGGHLRKERRAEIQRQVRKNLFEIKRRDIQKIEQGVGRDDFIRILKNRQVGGGNRKEGREKMKKGPGQEWIRGEEMKKEWVETFARVGRGLKEKKGFDEEFRREVEEQVEEWGLEEDYNEEEEIEEELGGEWRKTSLNGEIEREEVREAIRRLKNNTAAGIDEVVGEILKYGGKWMVESVYKVCRKLFSEEEMPAAWLRAIKVPIMKKGNGEEYGHYRGITLLSVVGKVYTMVLERRMRLTLETKHKLGEGQFGFREGRSTVDAIFIVDDKVRRAKGKVYLGFLDIEKAYPSVWREGLWFKLKKAGITGRMWRVVKKFYEQCEVAVRVNGELQDWYEEIVGVREGCVLSPLLFAVFIAGLPDEIESQVKGVIVLLFADDVIIIAETREGLQKALDIAYGYSRRWRFAFNVGVEKSAVLVVGKGRGDAIHPKSAVMESFFLGEREIPFTQEYKYLGVMMEGGKGKIVRREAVLKRAKGAFWKAWGLGIGKDEMSGKAAARLWEVLVMPVLEYGSELESGNWDEAERLQRMAGRMILGVGNSVADEVVLGELGWSTIISRFEVKRLKYWWKLVSEKGESRVGKVYEEGRERVQLERAKKQEWCWQTRRLLFELGMKDVWENEEVGDKTEWKRRVVKAIQVKGLREWRARLAMKSKLWLYRQIKEAPKKEHYLEMWRRRVSRTVRLRAGVAALQVELGRRWKKTRGQRICKECDQGKVEDEIHFLVECPVWAIHRASMWEALRQNNRKEWGRVIALGREEKTVWMLKQAGSKEMEVVGRILEKWVREKEGKDAE
jgi:hypothetical protein